jgi:Methyltransferase small domain
LQSIVQTLIEQNTSLPLSGQTGADPSPRLDAPPIGVPSLLAEAWRLRPFVHPFEFSAFFSPEDTLLCVCAAAAARRLLPPGPVRITELTSGSGLVGFYLLARDPGSRLLGLDIDAGAARTAAANASLLGVADRARFLESDLWSPSTLELLDAERPRLLVCNPPYVPEPPGTNMEVEAGAGPHGTAHLLRALELSRAVQPHALALSWCSLSDPVGIVDAARAAGYELHELYVTAIADGEYSGSVHSYLRTLDDCFINEQRETLDLLAPDGSARFAYLLFAGAFRRADAPGEDAVRSSPHPSSPIPLSASPLPLPAARFDLPATFAEHGIPGLAQAVAAFPLHCSMLTRWDELRLRAMLHGESSSARR